MITSPDNAKVKLARSLLDRRSREQRGLCLIEGVRLIEDAMRAGVQPALLFFVEPAREASSVGLLLGSAESSGVPIWEVSQEVFQKLSGTVTSQGVLAVVPIPKAGLPADPSLVLVLDQVRDPGNAGTILRSAAAAGIELVMLTAGCADVWSPKVLRAGMGAHFRLAVETQSSWVSIAQRATGRQAWMADPGGETAYDQVNWTQRSLLVVGGETEGLSAEALALGCSRVAIPMCGHTESLNVAMAATVLLFEAARQLRCKPVGHLRVASS